MPETTTDMADPQHASTAARPLAAARITRWACILASLLLAMLLVPLAGHAYLGAFSRYIADDFCTASSLRQLGFWTSQLHWYRGWSGRFAFTFVVNLTQLAGPRITPWLPGLAIGLWLAALMTLLRRLRGSWPGAWEWIGPAAVAALVLSLTLHGTPNPYQSLYWQTGMLTYSLPLILATAYLAWLVPKLASAADAERQGAGALACAAVVPFVAGGFSETFVSLQTALLALGILAAVFLERGPRRAANVRLLTAGLLGSGLAMALIAFAPGNEVRRSLMPAPPDLWILAQRSVHDAYLFVYQVAKHQTIPLLLVVTLPAVLAFLASLDRSFPQTTHRKIDWLATFAGIPLVTALVLIVPFAPSEYAVSSYPDGRVLITQQYVLFLGIVVWSAVLGARIAGLVSRRSAWAVPLALLSAGVVASAWLAIGSICTTIEEAPAYREFAATWDDRDATLREAARFPADLVAVPSLRHMGGLAEIGEDPAEWINVCIAGAYDVGAVVAK